LVLVTGGAGFIGANFILQWLAHEPDPVVSIDKLTYAGNPANLASVRNDPRYIFVRADIGDGETVRKLLRQHKPRAIINFAAESHVDRSIHGPAEFIQTNVVGTFKLLEEARHYWSALPPEGRNGFRFVHVSSDEVYGSLGPDDPPFTESSTYAPNSPYAASKAAADHIVRSFHHTYGVPVITTNCSNNYGPYQFPEKLIPLMILNAIREQPLPVYGDGRNVRDWLYVEDHCDALRLVLAKGRPGETYNVGGRSEKTNLDVVNGLCAILDEVRPDHAPHAKLITFVKDRPGHDQRYAMDARKIAAEVGWKPRERFETGLRKTVEWYLDNLMWAENVTSGEYQRWMDLNYERR
jgi:dTDP-glucose 4,6-dehydratase